ncbi:Retrovirus Pol polyprotein [Fasciola gigantica]|uniref:Retrovirus Pol polyprotein n=1 Tax=Fasciola gigantica TaxID=46835 RepID=A0A504YPM1_FASGI|nr:Retrovirus Pol polyprotein [Fasciola gigantica]
MPFVTGSGEVVEKQPWGVNYLKRLLSGLLDLVCLFFRTMLPLDLFRAGNTNSNHRSTWGQGPPRPPGRRFGGIHGSGGAPSAPPMCGSGG